MDNARRRRKYMTREENRHDIFNALRAVTEPTERPYLMLDLESKKHDRLAGWVAHPSEAVSKEFPTHLGKC